MGRLIMWNLISLDGFFEGAEPWDLSFHELAWGPEMEQLSLEQLDAADGLVFGRATYEGMAQYWTGKDDAVGVRMNAIPKVVASRTLTSADWNNTTLVRDDAVTAIRALKAASARDLYVFGSAVLSADLLAAGLFDELRIGVAPMVLGTGTRLFGRGRSRTELRLLEARPLATGAVILRYAAG
jgi:dihydrofolate reductase